MATATKTNTKIFAGLRCPHCGEAEGLAVKVETLELECLQCSEEVTRVEVEAIISKWQRLFDWIESAGR